MSGNGMFRRLVLLYVGHTEIPTSNGALMRESNESLLESGCNSPGGISDRGLLVLAKLSSALQGTSSKMKILKGGSSSHDVLWIGSSVGKSCCLDVIHKFEHHLHHSESFILFTSSKKDPES